MSESTQSVRGSVVGLWRYPVKSMLGEELNAADVAERGLRGDRAYALVDSADGKVATAKNPRKWPTLFDFRAAFVETPAAGPPIPPVRITFPNGTIVSSDAPDIDRILSDGVKRSVRLVAAEPTKRATAQSATAASQVATAEEYWPDIEGLDHRDMVTDFDLPEGTFFDAASMHVLTTSTLDRLRSIYSSGRFEARRFRPNIVIETGTGAAFVENDWVGHTLAIGDVRLNITGPCPRCVMTTLGQGDLPRDVGILRTAAQHNNAHVGVYASVSRGGKIRRGDPVRLE